MSTVDNATALHKSFSWLSDRTKRDPAAQFAAGVMAVANGGYSIANLVRSNSMAADNGDQPLLSSQDLDCLVGLLIHSLEELTGAAEKQIDRLEQAAEKGAMQ